MGGYVLSVSNTTSTKLTIADAKVVILKNDGAENVYFEFNSEARIGTSFLAAGESLSFDFGANGVENISSITFLSATTTNTVRLWVY